MYCAIIVLYGTGWTMFWLLFQSQTVLYISEVLSSLRNVPIGVSHGKRIYCFFVLSNDTSNFSSSVLLYKGRDIL